MRRRRNEDGFALIAAIIMLTVILGLGAGLLIYVNGQQSASGHEQASEAAFNVAEAALNAQVGQLAAKWPAPASSPSTELATTEMPSECTSAASTEENDCPSAADLKLDPNTGATTCSGTDAWGSSHTNQWTTYVRRDEGESMVFDSEAEKGQRSYPEVAETGALWVRAVGVVQCHAVAVVSLVTRQRIPLEFIKDAIAGNWFRVTNKGNKAIVNRKGTAAQPAPVSMRCKSWPKTQTRCEEYEESKSNSQVSPPLGGENPKSTFTLSSSQLATLKAEAEAHGTFYSSSSPYHCPTSMSELEGVKLSTSGTQSPRAPVYIEDCGTLPNYELKINANGEANCEESKPEEPLSPGFLILANGTLELSGKSRYCGVIYAANENPEPLSKEAIVKLQGGTVVVGGIIVNGDGGIEFGSSGQGGNPANLVFESLAFNELTISVGAASTRNSFRILPEGE